MDFSCSKSLEIKREVVLGEGDEGIVYDQENGTAAKQFKDRYNFERELEAFRDIAKKGYDGVMTPHFVSCDRRGQVIVMEKLEEVATTVAERVALAKELHDVTGIWLFDRHHFNCMKNNRGDLIHIDLCSWMRPK